MTKSYFLLNKNLKSKILKQNKTKPKSKPRNLMRWIFWDWDGRGFFPCHGIGIEQKYVCGSGTGQ